MDDDKFPCLEKVLTLSVTDPLISCSAINSDYEIIAFILRSGDLILYALPFGKYKPVIRWIPWIDNVDKRLTAICFNPIEGEAILAVCSDRSLYVILSLALLNAVSNETSEDSFPTNCRDIVSLPSPILGESEGKPVAVAWWVRSSARDSTKHTAIIGFTHGLLVAFAIYTGIIVFKTSVDGRVCKIDVCSKPGKSFILVTNDLGRQWRITLNEVEEGSSTANASSVDHKGPEDSSVKDLSDTLDCDSETSDSSRKTHALSLKVEAEEKEIIPCKKEFKLNITLQKISKAYFSISNNCVIGSYEANLVTVDRMAVVVRTIHTLPHRYSLLVPTNSLLVFANDKLTNITVISQRYSNIQDSSRDGLNKEFNGESFIQEFNFDDGEKIRNLFCTDSVKEQCSVVTNQGIYCLRLKKTPQELVLHNILSSNNLRLAEKHSIIFRLDVQKLLCEAGDIKLRENSLEEARNLYALARNGNTHHVAMLAVVGHLNELLLALQSYKFTNTNKLQLTNMKLLVFVHQYLTNFSSSLNDEFREFLLKGDYDESCAISIIAQAGLCEELRLVMRIKGLQQTVLLCLSNIVRHKSTIDVLKCKEFWELMSDETLGETLLTKQNLINFHTRLVQKNLQFFDKSILLKFERLYNPFAHSIRNFTANIIATDLPLKLWMETYLLICVQLSSTSEEFSSETVGLYNEDDFREVKVKIPLVPHNISASFKHAYVLIRGNAYGWGCSSSGCLGLGPTIQHVSGPKVLDTLVCLKKRVLAISCGRNHSIALTNDGVYSWGSNKYGQLGVRDVMQSWYPAVIRGLFDYNIIAVCAGQYHSLALDDENRVFSWGWGVHGQLGHGDVEDSFDPKIIVSLNGKGITSMSAGQMHSVFLDTGGRVWACGSNAFGQLGIGDMKKSTLPVPLYGFTELVVLISSGYFQNCAVSTDGKVYQWGRSPNALRNAAHLAKRRLRSEEYSKDHALILEEHSEYLTPKLVDTVTVEGKIIKVAIGCEHCIILTDKGSLYSWGRNVDGQLGVSVSFVDRRTQNVMQPTLISIGAKIVDVACGWDFSIATDDCENVWAWGTSIHAKATRGSLAGWEGEIVMVNNKNRVIKLPHSANNVQAVPTILSVSSRELEPAMYHPVELPSVLNNSDWRCRMHYALEKCVALYNPSLIFQQCISIGEHDACSKLSFVLGDLNTATMEKLNSAKTENDQETVLRYFLPKAIDNPSQLSCVLKSIVTYWLERDLPTACFEKVCSCYLDPLTKPLGTLVFGVNYEVNKISTKLSTEFKLRLVKNMFQFDKENIVCVMKEFTDFDSAMIALDNPGDFIDISADQISKLYSESKQKLFVRLN